MARSAIELLKERAASHSVGRERAIGVAEGTLVKRRKRCNVSAQRVEIHATTSIGRSHGWVRRAVGDEAGATKEIPNGIFEVLNFIEVTRPMHVAVSGAAPAPQAMCIAEPFAGIGEVPDALVT